MRGSDAKPRFRSSGFHRLRHLTLQQHRGLLSAIRPEYVSLALLLYRGLGELPSRALRVFRHLLRQGNPARGNTIQLSGANLVVETEEL